MRPLSELIQASPDISGTPPEASRIVVTSITTDSRQVAPGTLFVALKGVQSDGAQYISQAEMAGAVAVLCATDAQISDVRIPIVRSHNPRHTLAMMAAAFYHHQPRHMVAVTGTDGKTSTADFFRQFWYAMGKSSASIGTLGILSGDGEILYPGSHTTPDPVQLHHLLADLVRRQVQYVGVEASSHGLDQHRLDGVQLEAAAFTNIARDHLDYHKTEQAYFEAKSLLFSHVLPEGMTAVLNQDDARFGALRHICQQRGHIIIGFGKTGEQLRVVKTDPHAQGQKASLELYGEPYTLDIPLVGAFQVMNILTALGLALGTGGKLEELLAAIPQFRGVPGRLEQVACLANGGVVFIDYAHTPMALANILRTLKPHTKGKLHVVFGCGGDRDKGKRPEMGRIAQMMADVVIVTDDNPRSEVPATIRKEILEATTDAKEVADRREAIYVALKGLGAGDILVIAGKGHEKTQTVGDKVYPFDDAEVTRDLVKELKLAA
jgi:UDP-N-acetylmuramoyl-L-alanyl-D-glutamate--2,6-diaminopimelate ligase